VVRQYLRILDEPITLFGEVPMDRRERLRHILFVRADDLPAGITALR
jgi:hypothetical protein